MSIVVRLATLEDIPAITAVHRSTVDTWRDPRTRRPTSREQLNLFGQWFNGGPWMHETLCAIHVNHLLLQQQLPLVAEMRETVIGEAEYYFSREPPPFGPTLHLSILYVHRVWRQQGAGRALLKEGERYARRHHLRAITVQPEEGAIRFYARHGFEPWLRAQEMQADAQGDVPPTLVPVRHHAELPSLPLRIGRYQCSLQAWEESFWPPFVLPGWSDLRRGLWRGEVDGIPMVLGVREQLLDAAQADGYAWLPADAPLRPAVAALCGLAAQMGFAAVDMLLPESALLDLRRTFCLAYQRTVTLWRKPL